MTRATGAIFAVFVFGVGTASTATGPAAGPAGNPATPLFREVANSSQEIGGFGADGGLAVRVDRETVRRAARRIEFPHPSGWTLRAVLTDHEVRGPGDVTWRGRLEGTGERLVLSLWEGEVAGALLGDEGVVELMPAGRGWSLWRKADLPPGPLCGVETTESSGLEGFPAAATEGSVARAGSSVVIDILLLYSPEVRETLGSDAGVEALSRSLVDVTNTVLSDSDIAARLVLAGTAEIPRQESHDAREMLYWLRSSSWVHRTREEHGADLVALIIDQVHGRCGYGQILGPFSVTGRTCALRRLTFVHEIGHNFGMHHDPEHAPRPDQLTFPWSYGHFVEHSFRTIMTYPSACESGCPNLPLFSNPEIEYQGDPIGIPDRRDNHRTANSTAPVVADFQGPSSDAPPIPPEAPTELRASVSSPTEVALTWVDNSQGETGFQIETRVTDDGWRRIAEVPGGTTEHIVTDLRPATTYRFRIRAIRDGVASGYSEEAAVDTPPAPPAAPTGLVAEPESATVVSLRWNEVDGAAGYEVEVHAADPAGDREPRPIVLVSDGARLEGLEPEIPFTVRVRAVGPGGSSGWSPPASVTPLGPGGACVPGDTALCLLGARFELRAHWRLAQEPFHHGRGAAASVAGSRVTGLFSFFTTDNVELVVKMLDGREINGAFWLYYGALSDVEYWVSVRDTTDGISRTYHNPPGERCGRGDVRAFPSERNGALVDLGESRAGPGLGRGFQAVPAFGGVQPRVGPVESGTTSGACTPGPETLCLAEGRFRVTVEWENPRLPDSLGAGHVFGEVGNDTTGSFWFFTPDNLELAVKVLDGRSINDHFWLFWGALSDVEYTVRITDTETGEFHQFSNPSGTLCGGAVIDAL